MQCSYDMERAKLLSRCWSNPSLYRAVLADPAAFGIDAEVIAAFQQVDMTGLLTLADEQIPLALDSLQDVMAGMCRYSC